ncbi:MAG: hypothetical protein MI725_04550 [Pirellulales bacterium]|nr:hypothetical protein [Pirellulales bacterium]
MVYRLQELRHIDLERVAINLCQARKDVSHGIYASLTPLRFEGGAFQKKMRGRRYGVDRIYDESGREYLYILSFYLPRFMTTSLEEKISMVLHELWHISPQFNGDLRRHEGRCYAHGPSQRAYDAQMDGLAQTWLALDPPEHLYDFLLGTFDELVAEHGKVTGAHWPAPKLVPL